MPSSADVRMAMAHALGRNNRWDQALEESQRALALDPLSTGLRHSAIALALGARRYDLAADEARRARALVPADIVAQELLAYALLLSGKARACLGSGLELFTATRAMCLQGAGQRREAAAVADSAAAALGRGEARTVYQYIDLAPSDGGCHAGGELLVSGLGTVRPGAEHAHVPARADAAAEPDPRPGGAG